MSKLELKHLAPYLPYDLEFIMAGDENFRVKMKGLGNDYVLSDFEDNPEDGCVWCDFEDCKPILSPLSDLNKEIEIDGRKTTAAKNIGQRLAKFYGTSPVLYKEDTPIDVMEWTVFEYQEAIKLHFDVFGLVEQGLAIDINTIEK